jgi:hypothetical protein
LEDSGQKTIHFLKYQATCSSTFAEPPPQIFLPFEHTLHRLKTGMLKYGFPSTHPIVSLQGLGHVASPR